MSIFYYLYDYTALCTIDFQGGARNTTQVVRRIWSKPEGLGSKCRHVETNVNKLSLRLSLKLSPTQQTIVSTSAIVLIHF